MFVLCPLEHIQTAATAKTLCCPAAMFSPTKALGYPNLLVIRFAAVVRSEEVYEKKFLELMSVECEREEESRILAPEPVMTRGCRFGLIALERHEE